MRLNRTVVAVVVVAVLLAVVAPAVQAVPIAKPQTSPRLVGSDWLSAALTWLSHLFGDRTPQTPTTQQKGATTTSSGTTYPRPLGGDGSFAGSCIDPMGSCNTGG
jgi:hypothetical protein